MYLLQVYSKTTGRTHYVQIPTKEGYQLSLDFRSTLQKGKKIKYISYAHASCLFIKLHLINILRSVICVKMLMNQSNYLFCQGFGGHWILTSNQSATCLQIHQDIFINMNLMLYRCNAAKLTQHFIKKQNIVHLYVWFKDWTSDEIGSERSQFRFQKKRNQIKEVPGSLLGVR